MVRLDIYRREASSAGAEYVRCCVFVEITVLRIMGLNCCTRQYIRILWLKLPVVAYIFASIPLSLWAFFAYPSTMGST